MTTHEDISMQLSAYLDGELTAGDAQRVESAVASDAALAAELEQLRKTRRLVQSLPRQKAGEDFAAKVMQAALQQGALTGGRTWTPAAPLRGAWRRYLAAAALIVFAVGLGVYVSISMYDVSPQPSGQSELAIKTPDETRDGERVVLARRLDDLQADETKTEEAPGAVNEKPAEEPVEEYAFAKAALAPTRSKAGAVMGKGSRDDGDDEGETFGWKKDDAAPKNAPVHARKGPAGPYDQPADALVGPQTITALASNVAPTDNEVIYTDNLAVSQKQVEAVLLANAVEIAPRKQRTLQPSQANMISPPAPADRPRMKLVRVSPARRVQYIVYGSQDQLQQVRTQLENDVRAKQNVAQRFIVKSRQNGQALLQPTLAPSMPPGPNQIARAEDIKEAEPSQSAPVTVVQATVAQEAVAQTTPPAASQPQAVALAEQPASRQVQAGSTLQQNQSPQSPKQLRETLQQNQAMLITLEYRPAAEE